MSDTSLVFNLVARDNTAQGLSSARERFDTAAAGIGAGVAAALGAGVAANLDMEAANSKLAAQLGVGPKEAAELSKVSASVYENAWGDSVQTVNEAIRGVYQNIGDTSQAEGGLEGVTTKALALAQTFDQEVGPTTAAVGQMLKTGLAKNADEAFDILTRGFQTGANKADDLLDTVNEYGTQWRKFGLDGKTAMGLLSQGLQGGARDADIVADSIKEFSIRAIDGSTTTADGFKMIGLNADDMAKRIGKGGASATGALDLTLDRLRNIKDPVLQSKAAVALFGTQAEDLGQALYSLDPSEAVGALGEVGGAADKMAKTVGDNPAAALESFKRKAVGELGAVAGVFLTFATENEGVMRPLMYTLMGLAATVLLVKGAMMTYAAISSVVAGAHAIINASTWGVIGNWMRMMGIGLMAYLRIGASAVASAATTAAAWTGSALVSIGTWLAAVARAALTSAAHFLMMAGRAVVWAATMAASWVVAMGPVGWVIAVIVGLVALIIANWDTVKQWTGQIWDWVWGKIQGAVNGVLTAVGWLSKIPGWVSGYFGRMKDAAVQRALALVDWVRGLPGRLSRAIGGMGSLLTSKGKDVIRGLWNGISSMGGWLWGQVKNFVSRNVVDAAKSFLRIGSPSKLAADEIGQWVPAGVAEGIEDNTGVVDKAMAGMVNPQAAAPTTPLTTGMASSMGGQAGGIVLVRFEMTGAEDEFHRFMRKLTRVKGRGNVQTAFGQSGG
ncbi:phage tail tape measure protein [Streptomyces sp. NPDC000851]